MTPIYQTPEKIKLKFEAIKEPDSFWQGKKVLDVGCNEGLLYPLLKDKVKEYVGIETSIEYLLMAKKNFPGVRFEMVDMRNLNEKFDIIISLSTFHILDDEEFEKVVKKYSKLCKVLIMEFPVKGSSSIYHTRNEEHIFRVAGKYFEQVKCYGISPSPHDLQSTRKVFKCEHTTQ